MLSRQSSSLSSAPSIAPDGTPELATVVKGTIEASGEVKIQGKKRKAATSKQSTKRAKTTVTTESIKHEADVEASLKSTQKKARKTKVSTTTGATVEGEDQENDPKLNGATTTKIPRKRKTKEEKAAEAMPLSARTVGSKLLVGAHVSAAGGVSNSIANCVRLGGNAFALFLKSQRTWTNKALTAEQVLLFRGACKTHNIEPSNTAVPHGSYLVNLAHTDAERTTQAYNSFLDDLTRCEKLGIKLYNFHPGNSASSSREDAIAHIAENLNRAHADETTGSVVTVLETMASLGNTVGGTFEDLAAIIALTRDKSRIGVCIDTCHVFAAGYDLRTPEAFQTTMEKFDRTIGFKYLKALHVNDSKAPLASYRDLHANIGTGFLGLRAFHNVVNEPRLWGLPMVLETPIEVVNADGKKGEDEGIYAREIKLLESLVGMDAESEEFVELEKALQAQGAKERERVQDQVTRKKAKDLKVPKKGKAKGKKAKTDETSDEDLKGSE